MHKPKNIIDCDFIFVGFPLSQTFLCSGDKAIWQIVLTTHSQQRNDYVVQWLLKKFYNSEKALWYQVPKKVILRGAVEHPAMPVQTPDMETAFFFSFQAL